jgi:hypothetical protein
MENYTVLVECDDGDRLRHTEGVDRARAYQRTVWARRGSEPEPPITRDDEQSQWTRRPGGSGNLEDARRDIRPSGPLQASDASCGKREALFSLRGPRWGDGRDWPFCDGHESCGAWPWPWNCHLGRGDGQRTIPGQHLHVRSTEAYRRQ